MMEAIRQNGKIVLYSNDSIGIKIIFRNFTGRNFKGQKYANYIRYITIESMGFRPVSSNIAEMARQPILDSHSILFRI